MYLIMYPFTNLEWTNTQAFEFARIHVFNKNLWTFISTAFLSLHALVCHLILFRHDKEMVD